jgi:hypothetical protein
MVSTYYHGCQFHALAATRTSSPTGVGVGGLSHLPRYGQVAKLVLPCLGNSCDICRHAARRITSKEKVDIYGGHEAASVNKASETVMVVCLTAR